MNVYVMAGVVVYSGHDQDQVDLAKLGAVAYLGKIGPGHPQSLPHALLPHAHWFERHPPFLVVAGALRWACGSDGDAVKPRILSERQDWNEDVSCSGERHDNDLVNQHGTCQREHRRLRTFTSTPPPTTANPGGLFLGMLETNP